MSDWTAGYLADIDYTFGYYEELNPLRTKLAFLNDGLVPPQIGTACELGFGQGLSVNIHAAASDCIWEGTDFNPAQAGFAKSMAGGCGSKAKLYDQAFAEFANRADLPEFDYIGIHGIWSWISNENRAVLVDFVRRKLKVGGVLYISYNTQPGWAAMAPMRDLLVEHAATLGAKGNGIINRIEGALTFADKLITTNPQYARVNPLVAGRLEELKKKNRNYLAHEYFNRDWLPMSFSHMADWLEPAKLNYACSAYYLDHIDALNLSSEQLALLKDIPDPMFRQTVRDFCVNQQFRRDYWVKGARILCVLEQKEALREQRLILIQPRADVSLKVKGALGEAKMLEEIYGPILDVLADHKPKKIVEIEKAVNDKNIGFSKLLQSVMVLVGSGKLQAVQEEKITIKAKAITDKLNLNLMDKARGSRDINHLASPVTGGGVAVSFFQQLFLLAMRQDKKQPQEWAQFVWQILEAQGQKLVKEEKKLETVEENLAELNERAMVFAEKQLPILKGLQIV